MLCLPFLVKRKKSRKAGQETTAVEEWKEKSEDIPSPPVSPTAEQPTITFTTYDNNEEEEEEQDDFGTSILESSVRCSKRRLRQRTQKTSVTSSDRGYSSALSLPIASSSTLPSTTSTVDVFRPRTLTGTSSNGSSCSYHTPQGSVHNDPSPTSSGGAMPPFSEGAVDTTALQMQMLECISEKLDRLVERVGQLEASVSEGLGGGERAGEKLVVDSLPDLTEPELPNAPCDTKVLLWLVNKVSDWKFLARWLGLQESDITQIEIDNPRSGREQSYQMLLKWKSVAPERYSYPVLGEALRQENKELFNAYVKEVHRVER